jgi:hypothetical protein
MAHRDRVSIANALVLNARIRASAIHGQPQSNAGRQPTKAGAHYTQSFTGP